MRVNLGLCSIPAVRKQSYRGNKAMVLFWKYSPLWWKKQNSIAIFYSFENYIFNTDLSFEIISRLMRTRAGYFFFRFLLRKSTLHFMRNLVCHVMSTDTQNKFIALTNFGGFSSNCHLENVQKHLIFADFSLQRFFKNTSKIINLFCIRYIEYKINSTRFLIMNHDTQTIYNLLYSVSKTK